MTEPVFRAEGLTRRYRNGGAEVVALDSVDLTLDRGRRLGIVGESGSGKSTLVRLLAGLDRPTAGRIWFEGTEITGLPERRLGFLRAAVQMVFQDPRSSLNPRMKVGDIITEPLRSRLVRKELADGDHRARLVEVRSAGHGVRVGFDDGSYADGDVLIGADGRHSRVRDIVGARHAKRPSPASSVQIGTARATIALRGNGPK